MDNYSTIAEGFQEVIELISVSVDSVAEPLERAAAMCTEALLAERKLLCCGNGPGATVAELLTIALVHRFEHERPALPAACLNGDGAMLSALGESGADERFARQVRALGQAGDVLLCLSARSNNRDLIATLRAAHDRGMRAIVLSAAQDEALSVALAPEDIEIGVPAPSTPRLVEFHTMLVHALCKLIDQSLFGSYDP